MLSQVVGLITALDKLMAPMLARQDRLKKQNKNDYILNSVIDTLQSSKNDLMDNLEKIIKQHPAYPWFSKIKGVNAEGISKVLSPIRVKIEYMCNSCGNIQDNGDECLICHSNKMRQLDYADTISSLWRYAGLAIFPDGTIQKWRKGEKLDYNPELKTACWHVATSILKSGLRKKCLTCGELLSSSKVDSHKCSNAEFVTVATSRYAQYYLNVKEEEYKKVVNKGIKVIQSSDVKSCNSCGAEITPKYVKYCPSCNSKLFNDDSVIYEGRIHNRALRKMLRLFLAHLWIVWREKLGLEVTKPRSVDRVDPPEYLDPWLMIDR